MKSYFLVPAALARAPARQDATPPVVRQRHLPGAPTIAVDVFEEDSDFAEAAGSMGTPPVYGGSQVVGWARHPRDCGAGALSVTNSGGSTS